MNTLIVDDQNLWNSFIKNHAPISGEFLHSWAWGDTIKNRGRKIYRLGLYDDGLVGIALLIENPAAHKKYFYIPRGPILKDSSLFLEAIKVLANFAKKEGAIFLRFEPAILAKDFDKIYSSPFKGEAGRGSILKKPPLAPPLQGGKNWFPARHLQPENTLLLDLSVPEEELKAAMHEKTRYNIGLAERKGVVVNEGGAEKLDDFMRLLDETAKRDKIKMYGRGYFESILKSTNDNFGAKLWIAYFENKPLAAAFNVYFNNTATYLFGASSDEHRNLMAPHLLQWKMILGAKARGYKYYDFWGINPRDEKSPNYYPRWEGFSRFKRGFVEKEGASLELLYAPCLELPISKFWYTLFKIIKKFI